MSERLTGQRLRDLEDIHDQSLDQVFAECFANCRTSFSEIPGITANCTDLRRAVSRRLQHPRAPKHHTLLLKGDIGRKGQSAYVVIRNDPTLGPEQGRHPQLLDVRVFFLEFIG